MNSKTLQHSLLFNLFWAAILGAELYTFQYKTTLLCIIPLSFLLIHFRFFTTNFTKEFTFVVAAFFIGLFTETLLPNLEIYHFGLVDSPGFKYPPPWVTALWMIFPLYLVTALQILNKYKIFGAYVAAVLTLSSYAILGEKLDLVFFEAPMLQSYVLFILAWYLIIRGLFQLNTFLTKRIS